MSKISQSNKFSAETALTTTSGRTRITSLTGLRWFAALAVYLSHTLISDQIPQPLQRLVDNGYAGVTIFFVLSGFILTVTYLNVLQGPKIQIKIWNYFVARCARIFPVYFMVLGYVALRDYVNTKSVKEWIWEHILLIQAWDPKQDVAMGLNAPAWSISVEFFLYLLLPVLLFVFRKQFKTLKGSWILVIAATVFLILMAAFFVITGLDNRVSWDPDSAHRWLYRTPLLRIGDFVLGMGLAGIYFQSQKLFSSKIMGLLAILSFTLILLLMLYSNPGSAVSWDVMYALPTGVLILSLSLSPEGALSKYLSSKHMILLGECSFAFYLLHTVVGFGGAPATLNLSGIVFYISNIALLVLLSFGVFKLVETPARVMIRNKFSK